MTPNVVCEAMLFTVGPALFPEYRLRSLFGGAKLGLLVRLKASAWKRSVKRSLMWVFLMIERSSRFWNGERNRLRAVLPKMVSALSQTWAPLDTAQGGTPSVPGAIVGM